MDNNGKVLEIGKEVKLEEAIGESIGIEKFGAEALYKLFDIIRHKVVVENNVNQFYEAAFQELANKKADIFIVDTTNYACMEIDTAADLEAASTMLLKQY